jgi:hypothetical protein
VITFESFVVKDFKNLTTNLPALPTGRQAAGREHKVHSKDTKEDFNSFQDSDNLSELLHIQ